MTIAEFLLARIAEDERIAESADAVRDDGTGRGWVDGPATASGKWWVYWTGEKFGHKATADHIAHHDPARILAECAAKRTIVGTYSAVEANRNTEGSVQWHEERALLTSVQALAAVYSDHPDHQPDWAL